MLSRRVALICLASLSVTLLLIVSGLALAAVVQCQAGEPCTGTNRADRITGSNGNDSIRGRGGADEITARRGRDVVRSGAGNDTVNLVDGDRDLVDCGAGNNDTVIVELGDGFVPGSDVGSCENVENAE